MKNSQQLGEIPPQDQSPGHLPLAAQRKPFGKRVTSADPIQPNLQQVCKLLQAAPSSSRWLFIDVCKWRARIELVRDRWFRE